MSDNTLFNFVTLGLFKTERPDPATQKMYCLAVTFPRVGTTEKMVRKLHSSFYTIDGTLLPEEAWDPVMQLEELGWVHFYFDGNEEAGKWLEENRPEGAAFMEMGEVDNHTFWPSVVPIPEPQTVDKVDYFQNEFCQAADVLAEKVVEKEDSSLVYNYECDECGWTESTTQRPDWDGEISCAHCCEYARLTGEQGDLWVLASDLSHYMQSKRFNKAVEMYSREMGASVEEAEEFLADLDGANAYNLFHKLINPK